MGEPTDHTCGPVEQLDQERRTSLHLAVRHPSAILLHDRTVATVVQRKQIRTRQADH